MLELLTQVFFSLADASMPSTEISCLLVKQVGRKCIEHKNDLSVGVNLGRCFLTKLFRLCRVSGFFGNLCIDIPRVYDVLLQLTLFSSPSTQYFPHHRVFVWIVFCDSAIFTLQRSPLQTM